MSIRYLTWGVVCSVILVFFSACYENIEGCLDVDAENYNVQADVACDNCCRLPEFSISFSYLNQGNSLSLELGDSVEVAEDEYILITDFHFFISNVVLTDAAGGEVVFEDSLRIYENGTFFQVGNQLKYFDRRTFSNDLAGMRFQGTVNRLSFDVGLPAEVNYYNRDSLEVNSDLDKAPASADLGTGKGFEFFQLELMDTADSNVTEISYYNTYPLISVDVDFPVPLEIDQGKDSDVNLVLNVDRWLQGIDIQQMSTAELLELAKMNLTNAIAVKK